MTSLRRLVDNPLYAQWLDDVNDYLDGVHGLDAESVPDELMFNDFKGGSHFSATAEAIAKRIKSGEDF